MPSKLSNESQTTALDVEESTPAFQRVRVLARDRLAVFKKRHPPLVPAVQSCCYLLILFLVIQSYFYGSLFKVGTRTHALRVLAVDYDQGLIGTSLQAAYDQLQGPGFLTLDFGTVSQYPDPLKLDATLCGDKYWGVLYTHRGASNRLQSAISGNISGTYDPLDAITFTYNGVRYPVIGEAYLTQGMAELASAATQTLYTRAGRNLLSAVDQDNPASIRALYQPLSVRRVVQNPLPQGAVILLNTFTMIIPPLMQFFYVMALDHISMAIGTFSSSRKLYTYVARLIGSNIFAFCGSLTLTGCIWAFRETWEVTGLQFFETWFVFWFYMTISYLVMDAFIGTIVPMRFAPFFIFSFVILNVTSTLYPFELSPGFYRWAYALPAHNAWWLLMQVWSDGCVSQLEVALPVLFSWWVVGHGASAVAVWRKCSAARGGSKHSP